MAFVVGAAGFIGSHLTESLLKKGIQVVGVDNFSTGSRENLIEVNKDKDFHFLSQGLTEISDLELPRLDYAVFAITENIPSDEYGKNFKKFLDICSGFSPKMILCSSISLYDSKQEESDNLKQAEKNLAEIAIHNKINARVVRLAAVFGPKMHFRDADPIVRLIKSAVQDRLNQEQTPLEFTTRALFISDAVDLLIKTIMHGSTNQKIYDGVSIEPIKVSEIKQVLMDPVWYEEKGFKPTELPPWPTPNLNKTIKELSWKPRTIIISSLKTTLAYFKDHPGLEIKEEVEVKKPSVPWQFSKLEEDSSVPKPVEEKQPKEGVRKLKVASYNIKHQTVTVLGLVIIFFAIFFPVFKFGFFALDAKTHLENSIKQTSLGNFDEALKESNKAAGEVAYLTESFSSMSFVKTIDFIKAPFETIEQSLELASKAINANLHTVLGAKLLATSFTVISGEKEGDTIGLLNDAKTELSIADSEIGKVTANLNDKNFTRKIPPVLKQELNDLDNKINSYHQTINLGKSLADLLPQIIAVDSEKSYLIVLQDNRILRPGGGVIRSYVEVKFNHGKLKEIKGDMVENLDRSYDGRINPPIELKNDLGESNWRLKDAEFDPDFPTSARNITWFYSKEKGAQVSGVVALDLVSAEKLLSAVGPLKTPISKIALTREGNQAAADILTGLVERIFYLSKQNWVVLAKNSEESLTQKHLLLYLSDQNAFSYLTSLGWTGLFPTQKLEKPGERIESLALSETNMTLAQDSTAIARSINIESKIDSTGIVSHKLTIDYSASDKLTDSYKNRLKIYLPGGTKMLKTTWDNKIIKDLSPFSDYGKSGYSVLLTLGMGEQKQLVMEYQDLVPVKFNNNQLKYQLNITKQISQGTIPVDFKLIVPPEMKVTGETTIKSDLSTDRTFEVILDK